jgi:hypothetical protein
VAVAGGGGVAALKAGPGIELDQQTGIITVSSVAGLLYQEIDLSNQTGNLQQDLGGYLETAFLMPLSGNAGLLAPTSAFPGARYLADVTYNGHTYTHPPSLTWVNGPGAPAASTTRDVFMYWIRTVQSAVVNGVTATIPLQTLAWNLSGFA